MVNLSLCNCNECPLNGRPKILSEGSEKADVVFVGIAPAREELILKRPFVGWSGQVLRKTAEHLGYKDYYITNVMLCPEDELSDSEKRTAIKCCSERLSDEIRRVNPKLTIALGNVPLKALTDLDIKIGSVEGRVITGLHGYVLPIEHPATLSRPEKTGNFPDFVDALGSGIRWLSGTYQQAITPETVVVDENNLPEVCQRLENANIVSTDLETTRNGFYPYAQEPDGIRCLVLAIDDKTAYVVPGESSPHFEQHPNYVQDERLKYVLNKSKCIFHFGQFDCGFLWQAGYKTKMFYDTFLAHYMLDEREYAHGLKALARKYLGAADWEGEMLSKYLPKKSDSFDLIPDDVLYKYASHDAVYTYQLYQRFSKQVNDGLYNDLIMPCANMFVDTRHRGYRIDIDVLLNLGDELNKDLEIVEQELKEFVGYTLNPNSPQEIAHLLYDELGILREGRRRPGKKDVKSGRSTDKRVLEPYKDIPIVSKILEYRDLHKLSGTYVSGIAKHLGRDWRLFPEIMLAGTVTGRLASKNPSIMNIPRTGAIKRLFVAEPGHYIVDADQGHMELRCYAIIAKDKYLHDLLMKRKGDPGYIDPHDLVGQETSKRCGREIDRITAKGGVFGRIYGRGLASFMASFGLSRQDAQELVNVIDSLFPTIPEYNEQIRHKIHMQGYLESYFGRRRHFGLLTPENVAECHRQGCNFGPQSMGTDVNLHCMLHIYNMRREFGAVPLFPVHDSILFDIESLESVNPMRKEMERYCEELVDGAINFNIATKVGKSWGEVR